MGATGARVAPVGASVEKKPIQKCMGFFFRSSYYILYIITRTPEKYYLLFYRLFAESVHVVYVSNKRTRGCKNELDPRVAHAG